MLNLFNQFFLTYLPYDKTQHVIVGMVIFSLTHLFFSTILLGWMIMLPVIVIGIVKEIYDYFHQSTHTPDVFDALATVAGGLIGFICTL